MQVNFVIPEPDDNGGWDFHNFKFLHAFQSKCEADVYIKFIKELIDSEISIQNTTDINNENYIVLGCDYQIVGDCDYIRVFVTKSWN